MRPFCAALAAALLAGCAASATKDAAPATAARPSFTDDPYPSTYRPIELFASAGLLYLLINWLIASGGSLFERSFRWGRP